MKKLTLILALFLIASFAITMLASCGINTDTDPNADTGYRYEDDDDDNNKKNDDDEEEDNDRPTRPSNPDDDTPTIPDDDTPVNPPATAEVGGIRVSQTTYSSESKAISGFLASEIAGEVTTPTLVSYDTVEELTPAAIAELPLGDIQPSEVKSASRVIVTYEDTYVDGGATRTATSSDELTKEIYVLKVGTKYRYLTTTPKTGETLTKAYYDSLFNAEFFKNTTVHCKMIMDSYFYMNENLVDLSGKMESITYYNRNAIHVQITGTEGILTGTNSDCYYVLVNMPGETENKYNYYLIDPTNSSNGWTCSLSLPEKYMYDYSGEYASESLGIPAMDYSYFIKTETGFKVNPEKLKSFYQTVFDTLIGSIGDFTVNSGSMEFIVNNNQISSYRITLDTDVEHSGITQSMCEDITYTFYDVGTTAPVVLPDDLVDYIESTGATIVE